MVYIKSTLHCLKIQWSNCNIFECLGLNVSLSPQISFVLVVIYRPPSADNSFYENFMRAILINKLLLLWGILTSTGRTNPLEKISNKSQTGLIQHKLSVGQQV